MNVPWIQLATLVVSMGVAALGIVGIVVAARLARGTASRTWRRDQLADVYMDLNRAVHAVLGLVANETGAALQQEPLPSLEAEYTEYGRRMHDFNLATYRVLVVGQREAAAALQRLISAMDEGAMFPYSGGGGVSGFFWAQRREALDLLVDAAANLLIAMRCDLGLKPGNAHFLRRRKFDRNMRQTADALDARLAARDRDRDVAVWGETELLQFLERMGVHRLDDRPYRDEREDFTVDVGVFDQRIQAPLCLSLTLAAIVARPRGAPPMLALRGDLTSGQRTIALRHIVPFIRANFHGSATGVWKLGPDGSVVHLWTIGDLSSS